MTSIDVTGDDAARCAVREKLGETLFLEAGAGSGKTSCLVDRFVALVESGVAADNIAAITFTEKSAAELVDRIRLELTKRAVINPACREGLNVLDNAAIGTLHSFAQRILSEYPVAAGLPPRFTVHDEIASQVAFDARWEQFADDMLDDNELEVPLRLLFASGGKPKHLRDVALAFNANWDLIVERTRLPMPAIPPVDVAEILSELAALAEFSQHCTDENDRLFLHLTGPLADYHTMLRDADSDDDRVRILNKAKLAHAYGQQVNWPGVDISSLKQRLKDLNEACDALRVRVLEGVLQFIASALAGFTARSAEARQQAGVLEFHDLLVLARNVLRDNQTGFEVRRSLAQRYKRLLLDEFQDTDPIQIEIAVLIASADENATEDDWAHASIDPGRLFFVGDPKQSIYRFRRADIGMFMKARDELVGSSESLCKNFRTGRPIVNWINDAFPKIIVEDGNSQPAYQPLIPVRDRPYSGPPVAFIGIEHAKMTADELRSREADDVAAIIRRMMREGWSVGFRKAPDVAEDEWRTAVWSDIAVLLPARTSLPVLERALEASGIPYRAETSSLVYGTREVRDLMLVARAVDDPTDSLAVVSALRTPAFGCGDDDLFVWHERHRGRWDHQGRVPDDAPADHPVALGLAWLGEQHRQCRWLSPSQMLERILRERRFFELAAEERRPRDLWRRLRFVLDQCRAWEEAGGLTLRHYLQWVEGQSTEGTRVIETVLPETDDNAVRILTVHGAKGLEFPIAILSGLTTQANSQPRRVEVRFPPSGGWAIKLSKRMSTSDFEEMQANEEQMDDHERRRLLYVAATRARDHLVISVHRKPRGGRTTRTAAELLFDEGWVPDLVELLDVSHEPALTAACTEAAPAYDQLPTLAEWRQGHDAAFAFASRPVATSATRLAAEAVAGRDDDEELRMEVETDPGLAKGSRDIDLPPWQKGRYGSAIGRAVHGALQTVDLLSGAGLAATCAAQAAAEGVLGREDVIEALAQAALDSDIVRAAAASGRHWREVYVGIPYGDGVFEGYIDLLYEAEDGLVVVDYKTDAVRGEAELDAKVERYSVQLRAYADAIGYAINREVVRAVLLFLTPNGHTARDVDLSRH